VTRVCLAILTLLAGASVVGLARPAYAAGVAHVPVPRDGRAVGTAHPDRVVGHGTPASCTSAAVVRAVAKGGVIAFDCGRAPVTIRMRQTAKVFNKSRRVVIDGGGLVTLDGGGKRRILYQNTCDPKQGWTTSHCDDQATPNLVVQHLTLAHGNARSKQYEAGSGGAIYARGGRLKIVDSSFVGNRCYRSGPDLGGGAVRVFDQYRDRPVYVVGSRFRGGRCSNGAALSSIGVSWRVLNSRFGNNRAVGCCANPAWPGTPGGGSGGAIYMDGNRITLDLGGTVIRGNRARAGGGGVFFVSNDRTGTMRVRHSTLEGNPSQEFENYPGIFFLGARRPTVTDSVLR
jgi:hypothetical protein